MGSKKLKKYSLLTAVLSLIIFCLAFIPKVSANQTVNNMTINVALDDQGAATFTENWSVTADEGSEIYKTIKLVGPQSLSDYQVSMDGRAFKRANTWDTDATREQKAYRYGQNGHELNWGITKYGTHHYTIKYKITNFVEQTKTEQMIAWQFLNEDVAISPDHIEVTLSDPKHPLSVDKGYGIWAFGFAGQTAFHNGQATMKSTATTTEDDFVKMIVQIPKNTYQTAYKTSRSFDSYMKEAFKGSDYDYHDYKNGETINNDKGTRIAYIVMAVIGIGFFGIVFCVFNRYRSYRKYYPKMTTLQKQTKQEYYREIPTNNIYNTYIFFNSLLPSTTVLDNFLTVALLQLLKDGQIVMQDEPNKRGKERVQFVLTEHPVADDAPTPIKKFYQMMVEAATDGVVTQKSLAKHLNYSSKRHVQLTKAYTNYSREYAESHNLIYEKETKRTKTGDKKGDRANQMASWLVGFQKKPAGEEVEKNLARLKNYLQEFTLLAERTPQEVGLWDELMIAAAAFGILEEVADQLAQVYPNYQQDSVYYYGSMHPFMMINHFSHTVATQTRSYGGGGSTSAGGGGSFGGGSGGGGFR